MAVQSTRRRRAEKLIARNWTVFQCRMHSTPMTTHQLHANPSNDLLFNVLEMIYRLTPMQARIDASALARHLGTTPTEAARALVRLEQLGLADASRARLTLRGLAVAATSAGQRERVAAMLRVA